MPSTRIGRAEVFFHEWGDGPPILALHASLGNGTHWKGACGVLARSHRVVAPDLHGEGRTPRIHPVSPVEEMRTDLRIALGLLDRLREPVHLVGHSYGGVLAALVARAAPERVRSLALLEPVSFELLSDPRAKAHRAEIVRAEQECAGYLRDGQPLRAAEAFVTYWAGSHAWPTLPPALHPSMARAIPKAVAAWTHQLQARSDLDAFRDWPRPTLLLAGTRSPAPALWMTDRWAEALPRPARARIPGAGHLSLVSHPRQVGEALAAFIGRHARGAGPSVIRPVDPRPPGG